MPEVTEEEYAELEALRAKKSANSDAAEPETDADSDDDTPMIVHRVQYQDSEGNHATKEHRVPVAEWPEYERKHNL